MNNLWREVFSEIKSQHTTIPSCNPSSNPVEHFHWTLTAMLRTRGPGVQDNWDLWFNASVFAYKTTVKSSSSGVMLHYPMFGLEAMLHVDWVFSTPSVSLDQGYAGIETMCLQEYERGTMRKSKAERSDVQAVNTEYPGQMFSLVF